MRDWGGGGVSFGGVRCLVSSKLPLVNVLGAVVFGCA
jgi:hypothetical protein